MTNGQVSAADAGSLVTLRGLLEEATRRTADSTELGRRVATILLDGAAEAAIAIALAKFNIALDERDTLETGYSKLVEQIKASGLLHQQSGVIGWPDVRSLRRVRNNAQHHQIPPDHATIVKWSASVQRFVEAVVDLVFSIPFSLGDR